MLYIGGKKLRNRVKLSTKVKTCVPNLAVVRRFDCKRMLTTFVSIGSYSPEVRTFGTLITSTKVFSLIIICKSL